MVIQKKKERKDAIAWIVKGSVRVAWFILGIKSQNISDTMYWFFLLWEMSFIFVNGLDSLTKFVGFIYFALQTLGTSGVNIVNIFATTW